MASSDFFTWLEAKKGKFKTANYGSYASSGLGGIPTMTQPAQIQPTTTGQTELPAVTPQRPDTQQWSTGTQDERMKLGHEAEDDIKMFLKIAGIIIDPATKNEDMYNKIDGYWKGQPVQIKRRTSTRNASDDIAYEVLRGHNPRLTIEEQLQNPRQVGRDYKGMAAKWYFVQNVDGTAIYMVDADKIREAVYKALDEVESQLSGYMDSGRNRAYQASNGVDIRRTEDRGKQHPNSILAQNPMKIMAFVPASKIASRTIPTVVRRA